MQDCRITVVGGHSNVQNHIAEKVPGIRFLKAEAGSVDPSLIKNSDLVVFFANHLSHAKYNTVKQIATNHSVPYMHINSNNVNAALKKCQDFFSAEIWRSILGLTAFFWVEPFMHIIN